MKIINKTFSIGDTYRGTRGDLFTVTATGTRKISGTRRTSTATVTLTHEGRKDLPWYASQKKNTTASVTTTNPPIRITKVITLNGLDAVVHFFPDTVLSYSLRVSALKLFNLPPGSRTRGGTY